MTKIISIIHRSHVLKIIIVTIFGIISTLIDHAMYAIFDWSFFITWQFFALIFIVRPTTMPLLTTLISIVFDTLSGMTIGYTAILMILMQIITLLFQDLFRSLPATSKALLMSLILLFIAIPDWALSCMMLKQFVPITPAFLSRLPCALCFPIFYFTATRIARVIMTYEFAQS